MFGKCFLQILFWVHFYKSVRLKHSLDMAKANWNGGDSPVAPVYSTNTHRYWCCLHKLLYIELFELYEELLAKNVDFSIFEDLFLLFWIYYGRWGSTTTQKYLKHIQRHSIGYAFKYGNDFEWFSNEILKKTILVFFVRAESCVFFYLPGYRKATLNVDTKRWWVFWCWKNVWKMFSPNTFLGSFL